jgi:transposase
MAHSRIDRSWRCAGSKRHQASKGKPIGALDVAVPERKLWGFALTLGYSPMMMAAAALDQKLGTLSRMREEGFRQLGGVPAEILYDRMRTVWVDVDERGREPSGLEDFNAQLRA